MSRDTRIGLASVLLGLFGIAAFYLWPGQKWIGWVSLGCCFALAVLWAVLEVSGRPRLGRQTNEKHEAEKSQQSLQSLGSEWEKMAERFREFERSEIVARYTHWSKPASEWWELSGGKNMQSQAYFKSLCKMAGASLLRTKSAPLSQKLRNCDDDFYRWLFFLKENFRASQYALHGVEALDDGSNNLIVCEDIRDLALVSATACMECAARELGSG